MIAIPNQSEKRGAVLATACGIHAIQDGLYATVYVLLPVLAPVFGLSYVQVGVLRAAFSSAMTLLQIPSGVLVERFGERILLVSGLACSGLAYLFLAGSLGVMTIGFGLFLAGLGAAFQHAPSSSLITGLFLDGRRRAALGTYNAAGDAGKLGFAAAFTLAIGVSVTWNHAVAGLGALALVSAVAVFLIFRRLGVGGRPAGNRDEGYQSKRIGWGIRDRRGFTALTVIVFLDLAVQSGFLTFLAFLMAEKQVPTSLAVFAVVLTLAGGILGKLGCGFLADRIGGRKSLVVVQCLTALGIVVVLLSPNLIAFLVLPLLGVVLQGSSTVTYGSVSDLVHTDRQSRGFAFIYSVSSAAGITGPIVFGSIGDQFGLAPAMLAMAFAVLLTLPLSGLIWTKPEIV
jgi:MFS family permease